MTTAITFIILWAIGLTAACYLAHEDHLLLAFFVILLTSSIKITN